METFESYLRKVNTSKEFKIGDKVRYIGKSPLIKPNKIYTFLELKEISGILYAKIKVEYYNVSTHIKNIIKV